MEFIVFHQLIMQGMHHLNTLTNLDVVWYNTDYKKIHAFQSMETPDVLDFDIETDYPIIDERCYDGDALRYCAAATSSFLEFVFIPLVLEGENQGMVRIGPFLTGPLTEKQLSAFIVSLSLPISRCQALRNYYESLPMYPADTAKSLGHIGLNLFGHTIPRTHSSLYQSERVNTVSLELYESSLEEDIANIERRYEFERLLTQAISSGDRFAIEKAMDFFSSSEGMASLMNRFPENPLRSVKNLAIVFNTILRHAAEKGGLHPAYLHEISKKYALLIENAKTRTAVQQLQDEMPYAYADMVRKYAFPDTSPFIRKVIDHILLNLNMPLSLSDLSEFFNIQPSNLANQFKHETGQTVTEFINTRRISEACYYLKNSDMPIGEISLHVGINDANYFSRLFRKQMDMSPLQYRNSLS